MMRENYATVFDRQPLFPGGSCKLLSPRSAGKEESKVDDDELKNDQLGKIFEVIGTPKEPEDLGFITS